MRAQGDGTTLTSRSSGATIKVGGPTAETRRSVLLATADLIDRLSYPSVTIDAVARASGVSKSTIYRYWPSRQALILEAYTYKTNQLTSVPDTGNALEDLQTYLLKLAHCLNFAGAASTVSGLIVDAINDDEFAQLYRATLLQERRKSLLVILLKGQRRGQIRKEVDLGTAIDAIYGAVHHRLLVSGQRIDEPFVAALTDLALRGISTAHAQGSTK
jgi:AcrR family transcriptional regulator